MDTKRNTFTESTAGGIGNTDVLAVPPRQVFYFQSDVNLDPVAAVVGASFVLSGTTSCDQLKDILSDQGNETEIFVRHADDKLTNVLVTVGDAAVGRRHSDRTGRNAVDQLDRDGRAACPTVRSPSASRRSRAGIRRRPGDPPSSTSRRRA